MTELYRYLVAAFYLLLTVLLLARLRLPPAREALTGGARTILQLLIMGSLLTAIFRVESRVLDAAVLGAMIAAAAVIASRRSRGPRAYRISLAAIGGASALVILPMVVTGAFDLVSSFLIPISGMVIGNAMNATALAMERLDREMETGRQRIEALLALGVDPHRASQEAVTNTVSAALIPSLNGMKSIGIVHIPGLMTGMLLSGAPPVTAALMQAFIIYLVFIGAVLSSLTATRLRRKTFFTHYQSLKSAGR